MKCPFLVYLFYAALSLGEEILNLVSPQFIRKLLKVMAPAAG